MIVVACFLAATTPLACNPSSPATPADDVEPPLLLDVVNTEPEVTYEEGIRIVTLTTKEQALRAIDDGKPYYDPNMEHRYLGIHDEWHYMEFGGDWSSVYRFHLTLLTSEEVQIYLEAKRVRLEALTEAQTLDIPFRSFRPPEEFTRWREAHGF
jgi:hypothetical protein